MYDMIARNKRNSILLISGMMILVIVVGAFFGQAGFDSPEGGLIIAGMLAIVLLLISWFSGRSIILGVSGAKKIQKSDAPQIYNIVEELTIASGLPMPEIYIINDTAPNAFATGRDPQHAAIAVTSGLMEKLNRDEIQGVIAHELSHVKNYDIRFAMLMAVMVGVIALMCDYFRRWVFWGGAGRGRRGRGRGGSGQAIFFLIAITLSIIAPIFALFIQMAMSREREYLADASAAEMTRYPEGLASALEKISRDTEVLEVANRATQHLYIVNPIKPFEKRASGLFSTHPPIEERIARLRSIGASYMKP
jgi:heat shock protein HtpX